MPFPLRYLTLTLTLTLAMAIPAKAGTDTSSVLAIRLGHAPEASRLFPALFTLPVFAGEASPAPVVVLVTDAYALDQRVAELSGVMVDQGWATLQVDLDPASHDHYLSNKADPAITSAEVWDGAAQLMGVLAYLGERSDIDPQRVAVVGLGSGGRMALLAGAESVGNAGTGAYGPRFAAHGALYPGCAALAGDGYGSAVPWSSAPTVLFVPGQDLRDPPDSCATLRRDLAAAGRPQVRWHDYPTATYGWDIGLVYGDRAVRLPVGPGRLIRIEADPDVTMDAAARLVSFLGPILGARGSR